MAGPYDKIFIIGFNRCGTRTLHRFFELNGLPSIHWGDGEIGQRMVLNALHERIILDGYDGSFRVFSDLVFNTERVNFECNGFFRLMDRDYPGSAFILNTRNIDDWVRSRARHLKGIYLQTSRKVFGMASDEAVFRRWRREWHDHENDVREYFEGRKDLLVFNIDHGSPQDICDFLGLALDNSHYGWIGRSKKSNARL